jgi:hypothetical protein
MVFAIPTTTSQLSSAAAAAAIPTTARNHIKSIVSHVIWKI